MHHIASKIQVYGCRHDKVKDYAEFIIDETFGVPGVGTVIAGTVKKGVITTNANLMLGPDVGDGTFKPTAIKSIQYKRLPVGRVNAQAYSLFTQQLRALDCLVLISSFCPYVSIGQTCVISAVTC